MQEQAGPRGEGVGIRSPVLESQVGWTFAILVGRGKCLDAACWVLCLSDRCCRCSIVPLRTVCGVNCALQICLLGRRGRVNRSSTAAWRNRLREGGLEIMPFVSCAYCLSFPLCLRLGTVLGQAVSGNDSLWPHIDAWRLSCEFFF